MFARHQDITNRLVGQYDSVVLWGASTKATMFATHHKLDKFNINYVVDINKEKWGKYLVGTKIKVISPVQLTELCDAEASAILVMNEAYTIEVKELMELLQYRIDIFDFSME
jgi:hypothetical protein